MSDDDHQLVEDAKAIVLQQRLTGSQRFRKQAPTFDIKAAIIEYYDGVSHHRDVSRHEWNLFEVLYMWMYTNTPLTEEGLRATRTTFKRR